jgi:hypothetical protein
MASQRAPGILLKKGEGGVMLHEDCGRRKNQAQIYWTII